MARFTLDILGAPELSKAFEALPDNLERKVLTKALREAGKVLLVAVKARAPRDRGLLASTMKLKAMKRSRRRVGVMVQTGTRAELGLLATTRISSTGSGDTLRVRRGKETGYYPAHVELGTHKAAPNPFMRTSLRSGREGLLAIIRTELDNGIERAMRQAGP
jgi:HK97 gp10 family phage protein